MRYEYIPSTQEDHVVRFFGDLEHHHLFEPGGESGQYFLSQTVKSWLVANDMKVFVKYDRHEDKHRLPEFRISFQSRQDAEFFVETWSQI